MERKIEICIFAPIPPPFHGASYMNKLLLESKFSQRFNVTHINTSYVKSLEDLGKMQTYKLGLFIKYLTLLLIEHNKKNFEYIIIVPTFRGWPFLRDLLNITLVHYLTSTKIILWINNGNLVEQYPESNRLLKWYIGFALKKATHIVTAGNNLMKQFTNFLPTRNVSVIPNGIPTSSKRITKTKDNSRITIIFLSNFLKSKGWYVLLQAAREVCGMRKDVTFKFYGLPSSDSPLQEINLAFECSGYPTQIQYLGPIYDEDKERAFDEADIFCLPTFYPNEVLPLSILEAMQHRLAVITTNVGAITDAVTHEEGGLVVVKNDVSSLTAAIVRLLDDKEKIAMMGKTNKGKFYKEFHIDRVVDQWCDLFERFDKIII